MRLFLFCFSNQFCENEGSGLLRMDEPSTNRRIFFMSVIYKMQFNAFNPFKQTGKKVIPLRQPTPNRRSSFDYQNNPMGPFHTEKDPYGMDLSSSDLPVPLFRYRQVHKMSKKPKSNVVGRTARIGSKSRRSPKHPKSLVRKGGRRRTAKKSRVRRSRK
jgi:hypothetical protein